MKNLLFREITLEELVFEHRNHVYGAYAIRKNYDKNMSRALLMAILFFVAAFLSPGIIESFKEKAVVPVDLFENKVHEFVVNPKLDPVVVHKNNENPQAPKNNNSKSIINPNVVKDDLDKTNEKKPDASNENPNAKDSGTNDFGKVENTDDTGATASGNENGNANSSNEVYLLVDELPVFNDEYSSLANYLAKTIKYPQIARDNRIEGKVLVEFIIDKNGEVKFVNLLRGIGGGCDEEVMRVINKMPKWKAGIHHGKAVNVKLVLPVAFKLN